MKNSLNTIDFYELWDQPFFKNNLTKTINKYLNINEEYILLDLKSEIIGSYFILESKNNIIYIDFKLDDNIYIYKYLKKTSTKKVYFIIITDKNIKSKEIIIINNKNKFLNLLFTRSKEQIIKTDSIY